MATSAEAASIRPRSDAKDRNASMSAPTCSNPLASESNVASTAAPFGSCARDRPRPSAQTRNDAAAQVLGLILAEMRRLGAEPVSAAELNARPRKTLGWQAPAGRLAQLLDQQSTHPQAR